MSRFKVNGKRGDVRHNVKLLLEEYPELRDNKLLCTVKYWYFVDFEKKHHLDPKQVSAMDFMKGYKQGVFENQASIDRQWQKVQEDYPHLRGKTWAKRQEHSKVVKKDLGYK